jgi:hypothetical protein
MLALAPSQTLDATIIHAYDAPPVPSSVPDIQVNGMDNTDNWKGRASNLLCCFSSPSATYYLQSDSDTPSTASTAHAVNWGQTTGELSIFANPFAQSCLLGPQASADQGKITLVLDLDGAVL